MTAGRPAHAACGRLRSRRRRRVGLSLSSWSRPSSVRWAKLCQEPSGPSLRLPLVLNVESHRRTGARRRPAGRRSSGAAGRVGGCEADALSSARATAMVTRPVRTVDDVTDLGRGRPRVGWARSRCSGPNCCQRWLDRSGLGRRSCTRSASPLARHPCCPRRVARGRPDAGADRLVNPDLHRGAVPRIPRAAG